jgi:hypothetical protein
MARLDTYTVVAGAAAALSANKNQCLQNRVQPDK